MMKKLLSRTGTVRFRLILWYVLFLAVTTLSFSLFLHLELQSSLYAQVDTGLQVAASQLLVDMDDTVNPPVLRPMSANTVDRLDQSRFALRLVNRDGQIIADLGSFPVLPFSPLLTPGYETIEIDGISWRIYSQQVETQAQHFDVWLQMAQSLNIVNEARSSLLRFIGIGLPLVLIAAALGGLFMANRALRPVDTITRTVQDINATDLARRIHYAGPTDELGRLIQTLNSMLARLQFAFDVERRFTADASHELRTPLTAIKGQIEVTLNRQRTQDEYETTLNHLNRETDRLIRMANDLLFLARLDVLSQKRQLEEIDLSDLLEAVAEQVRPMIEAKHIAFSVVVPGSITVWGVPDHLIRLFLNILDNALKYSSMGGAIRLTLQQLNDELRISIEDNGQGIAEEHLPHLFDRFYRVERERSGNVSGTGLGLAIAYEIAREHAGRIEVASTPGQGTTFTVYLTLRNPLRL
jgi:heavy metal sensor kinase